MGKPPQFEKGYVISIGGVLKVFELVSTNIDSGYCGS